MDVDAGHVLGLAQARIGELEMEVLTLQAALAAQAAEAAEARAALEAIAAHQAEEQETHIIPPDGWGTTGQALRSPLD